VLFLALTALWIAQPEIPPRHDVMVDQPVPGVSVPYSTTLSLGQIYSLLMANGATPAAAAALTQISTREDGSGRVNIVNNSPQNPPYGTGDYSVGFFQLNFANGAGGVNASRNFGTLSNGQPATFTPQQLASNPNLQALAALALWNNGQGASNWTPSYLGPQATWATNTHPELSGPAIASVGNDFIGVANGALSLLGLPPIDPTVPPISVPSQQQTSGSTSSGSATTTTDGGGALPTTSTTTAQSGVAPGQTQLGTVGSLPINIPSGLVLALLGIALLLLGAILLISNTQNKVKNTVVSAVTERI
jgi:hypothetical protein